MPLFRNDEASPHVLSAEELSAARSETELTGPQISHRRSARSCIMWAASALSMGPKLAC